jgi:SAM-dependent methyltransferase
MLRGLAREAMQQKFASLHESEPVEAALEKLDGAPTGQGYVIGDGNRWIGVVRREDIAAAGAGVPIGALASPEGAIPPTEPLAAALETMATRRLKGLPVIDDGLLVGVLWREQAERFLSLADRLDFPLSKLADEISPDDEMFPGNLSVYLRTGASGLECIRRALALAGSSRPQRILDFGCGHGRVLRFVKAAFPESELTACDIESSAVEFCANVLGATPVQSSGRLSDVRFDTRFDLIWSGSLLTHVDESMWREALELFGSLLDRSGVLAFSTAGPWCAEALSSGRADYGLQPSAVASLLDQYRSAGFGYVDYAQERGYGISLASPEWTTRIVDTQPGLKMLGYAERAFDAHQDIVVAAAA